MAFTGVPDLVLLAGRALYGGVLAFMGLSHFMQTEAMTGYAEAKGLPAPRLSVLASGAALVLGGLAIALGVAPLAGAILVAGFLLTSAVLMHDFWAAPEEEAQTEMTQFLKNVALAGGALVVAAAATQSWGLAVGVGLV